MSSISLVSDTAELAEHYEAVSADRQVKAGRVLIADLGVRDGESVLDVGCGTGILAGHVADIVGPTGQVVGIDPLPLRIQLAKRKARTNLRFEVGDANDLSPFPEASFDVVYLNAVFHWLPEKLGPLRQFARVLKSGGRLGFVTGSKDHPGPAQELKREILSREPYARYAIHHAPPYAVSAAELIDLLAQTGFTEVAKLDVIPNDHVHASPEALIAFSEASSFGNFLGHLPLDLKARATEELLRGLEPFRTADGIQQGGSRIFAVAIKQ
jgi:ubiquinone/menaquinone biosynthesis C-methylase UbiE